MRTKHLFIILFLAVVGTLQAQQHLPESKSLVGMWRMIGVGMPNQGGVVKVKSGNFKVINSDGTFYTFLASLPGRNTSQPDFATIMLYGTYAVTSDSTLNEHIVKHPHQPQMDNSESELKYKFVTGSDNNVLYMMWKNTTTNQWIPEMWERVRLQEKNPNNATQRTL